MFLSVCVNENENNKNTSTFSRLTVSQDHPGNTDTRMSIQSGFWCSKRRWRWRWWQLCLSVSLCLFVEVIKRVKLQCDHYRQRISTLIRPDALTALTRTLKATYREDDSRSTLLNCLDG